MALATAGNWGFAQKALTPERVDLAGRALLLFACASIRNQEKAHPTDTLSLRESPLRCSRARGDASTRCNILVATKHGGHPCPPSPARAALLGAPQGNPVRQTAKQKQIAAAACCPLSRVRERVARQRRVREHASAVCNLQGVFPHSPPSAGLSPASGREEQARQRAFERSAAKRSEPITVDVQPLAAPAGVTRAVGLAATMAARASSRQGCRVEATPSTSLQPGTRSSAQPSNGRGLRGVLSLLTFFARAKKVRPDRQGQNSQSTTSTERQP